MKVLFFLFYILFTTSCQQISDFLNEDLETEVTKPTPSTENKNITIIRDKLNSFSEINRVEIRNYIKNAQHPYQSDIILIKKIKTHLVVNGKKYLELNFFTNELDAKAPLIAQFILIDEKSKNILEESSVNLNKN